MCLEFPFYAHSKPGFHLAYCECTSAYLLPCMPGVLLRLAETKKRILGIYSTVQIDCTVVPVGDLNALSHSCKSFQAFRSGSGLRLTICRA